MKTNNKNEVPITRYLLGELSEEQQSQFEELYFADDELYSAIQVAERELIDRYVQGSLPAPQRARFETCFMALPARRRKVELARAFYNNVAAAPEARPRRGQVTRQLLLGRFGFLTSGMRTAMGASMLLLTIGCSLLIFETVRLRHLLDQMEAGLRAYEQATDRRLTEEGSHRQQPHGEPEQKQEQETHESPNRRPTGTAGRRRRSTHSLVKRYAKAAPETAGPMEQAGVMTLGTDAPAFKGLSPVATAVLEDRPTLRWGRYYGATEYRTFLAGVRMPAGEVTANTEWQPKYRLRRGRAYTWYVAALKNGRMLAMTRPATFRVISQEETDEIELIRKRRTRSNMELVMAYLQAGLFDDFEYELSKLNIR